MQIGMQVFLGLGVLTIVEYIIAVAMPTGSLIPLTVIALAKAWLILQYFMHMAQLWRQGGHGHD